MARLAHCLFAWFDTRCALLTMTYLEHVILSRPRSGRVEGRTT